MTTPTVEQGGKSEQRTSKPRRFEAMLAAMLAAAVPAKSEAQGLPDVPSSADIEEGIHATMDLVEGEADTSNHRLDMYVPWFHDGKVTMEDFGRILEPAYLEVGRDREAPQTVEFAVPYEYARMFDTGKPLSEADYDSLREFMGDQVREQLTDNLWGMSWDKSDYTSFPENAPWSGLTVDSIAIDGFASPEAHGAQSLEPGLVDAENIELAELRATDAGKRMEEVLQGMGINVEGGVASVTGDEMQFNDAEYAALDELGTQLGFTGAPQDKLYKLISAYNRNGISDVDALSQLDSIVGSKRMVEVQITFKDPKKDTVLIPLPLLLLLPLALRRFTRRPGSPEPVPAPTPPTDGSTGTDAGNKGSGEKDQGTSEGETTNVEVKEDFTNVEPTELEGTEQYIVNVETDIEQNFYFYQGIIDTHIREADPDVNTLTGDVLDAWTIHDNQLRTRMGQEPINHRENPRQVLYAHLHGIALKRMILETRSAREKDPHTPTSEVWNTATVRQQVSDEMVEDLDRRTRARLKQRRERSE